MKEVYLYGCSGLAINSIVAISLKYVVKGFIDSNISKPKKYVLGLPVYHISEVSNLPFDLIIITSGFKNEIVSTLKSKGISNYIHIDDLGELKTVSDEFRTKFLQVREDQKKEQLVSIPQVPLLQTHIENTKLLVDRNELLRQLPKGGVIAELGVANGDFSAEILATSYPRKLFLIDVWNSSRYSKALLDNVRSRFSSFIEEGRVEIVNMASEDAVHLFENNFFDWVYIDTTHSYEQTKLELMEYAKKIKPRGILAGHDYCMGNWISECKYGVIEAVHEFCLNDGYRLKFLTMDISESQSFAIEKV